MTPTERELKRRENREIKKELNEKLEHGDLKALSDVGEYHYNTYRKFFDVEDLFWSEGVYTEVKNYYAKKEQALS